MSSIRPLVLFAPAAVFVVLVTASLINLEAFLSAATSVNTWILNTFTHAFAWATFGFVLTLIWVFFSPLGKVRIGGAEAKPLLKPWNWFAITLCTTLAVGVLFWSSAEPMYHLYNPGGTGLAPGGEAAEDFAMASLYMHWSFSPYAIYCLPGLTFALCYYNLGKRYSLSAPLSVLFGRPVPERARDALDAVALLTLVLGMSASLGTGILQLSGGLTDITSFSKSTGLLIAIGAAIVLAFLVSSITGLKNGIRILSDLNVKVFIAFAIFVLIAGPTWQILSGGARGLAAYVTEFVPRSLLIGDVTTHDWAKDWTVFYLANWLAWAPLAALFLGSIARGYSVRAFIVVNFIAPALFSILWMSIFGGLALSAETETGGVLKAALDASGPEAVFFEAVKTLPFSVLLTIAILALSFVSYVTAADSNTQAIAAISQTQKVIGTPTRTGLFIKTFWAGIMGACALIMISTSGIDGIRMMSNLGGLPALMIVLTLNVVLILLGTVHLARVQSANESRIEGDIAADIP